MLRLIHLISVISKYSFIFFLIKLRLYRKPSPQLIRNFFEEAGGSFIKFGQILSLRIDVLPKEYSLELLDLLDNVKPFSFNDVVGIFRNELGAHPNEIFSSFEVNPIASASFGQVHVAYLNGEKVAVKIMRPGVENDVAIDFIVIRLIAIIVDQFVKLDAIPWRDSAKEFERWTRLELDYRNEAENNDKLYKSKRSSAVFIPKVYFHFSTQKILVQEFVEGIPLSKVMKALKSGETTAEKLLEQGIDLKKTPWLLAEELLREYFYLGFYHADPHPGNILLQEGGKIGLVDFGILGRSVPNQTALIALFKALSEYDYRQACYYLINFAGTELKTMAESAFPATVNQDQIDRFINRLADKFFDSIKDRATAGVEDLREMKTDHIGLMLRFAKDASTYRVRFPREMVTYFRALSIISFLARQLDFNFKMSTSLKNFFEENNQEEFIENNEVIEVRRMDRMSAIEKLANWLSFIYEKDPSLYRDVKEYIDEHNLLDLKV